MRDKSAIRLWPLSSPKHASNLMNIVNKSERGEVEVRKENRERTKQNAKGRWRKEYVSDGN